MEKEEESFVLPEINELIVTKIKNKEKKKKKRICDEHYISFIDQLLTGTFDEGLKNKDDVIKIFTRILMKISHNVWSNLKKKRKMQRNNI